MIIVCQKFIMPFVFCRCAAVIRGQEKYDF